MKTTTINKISLYTALIFLISCNSSNNRRQLSSNNVAPQNQVIRLPKPIVQNIRKSVFEVVVMKVEDKFMKYGRKLPTDKLSFKDRTDKYTGIGTAFSISKNKFVTAAHVLGLHEKQLPRTYYIRNQKGDVFPISTITKYSQYRDIAEFTLAKPAPHLSLSISKMNDVGDEVYSVGNAYGEGLAIRSGEIASYTPEIQDGKWKNVRFSAPVNGGNSGGPLINNKGEVVGIIIQKTKGENLNVATPIGELLKLSNRKSEFYIKGITRQKFKKVVTKDWKFSSKLPASKIALAKASEQSFANHIKSIELSLASKVRRESYPYDKNLNEYSRMQAYVTVLAFLEKNDQNKWNLYKAANSKAVNLGNNQTFSYGIDMNESGVLMTRYYLLKPEKVKLNVYSKDFKAINDDIVKGLSWGRQYAGETVPVLSYGKPHKTEVFLDSKKRPWVLNTWNTYFDEKTVMNFYHVVPDGVIGMWVYMPVSMSSYGLERMVKRDYIDRAVFSYNAKLKNWDQYFAISKNLIPDYLRATQISWKNKSLSVQTPDFNLRMPIKKINKNSSLTLTRGLNEKNYAIHEFHGLQFAIGSGEKESYSVETIFNPNGINNDKLSNRWRLITNSTAPYNNKLVTKGDVSYILGTKNTREVASTSKKKKAHFIFTCADSNDRTAKDLINNCVHLKNGFRNKNYK